jgi:hypothetical protein
MCPYGEYNTGIVTQTTALIKRHMKLTIRDPTMYTGRMLMFMFACSFFAVIYIKSRDREQDQIFNKLWLVVWLLSVPSCLGGVIIRTSFAHAGRQRLKCTIDC